MAEGFPGTIITNQVRITLILYTTVVVVSCAVISTIIVFAPLFSGISPDALPLPLYHLPYHCVAFVCHWRNDGAVHVVCHGLGIAVVPGSNSGSSVPVLMGNV